MPSHLDGARAFRDVSELSTRSDLQRAAQALLDPIAASMSGGGARVRVGSWSAAFPPTCQQMEAFCRGLWGVAPLVAGGGTCVHLDRFQEGLANGADPDHAEFWGYPRDLDQRLVEFTAVAHALLIAPDAFWTPLPIHAQGRLVDLLSTINVVAVRDNNWRFFRVLTNLALRSVGAPHDQRRTAEDLDAIDRCYLGGGWYSDGVQGARDYYVAFAMHFYGLLYAAHASDERAATFRRRADLFARDFIAWFSPDGSAIPYGRSLTYRFAQAAFWAALPVAGADASWVAIARGVLLRHLRWWMRRPIAATGGALTVGYGYENPFVSENYTSSSSPYWALKALLPLALPAAHPFWVGDEADLPLAPKSTPQPHPQMMLCRDGDHVFALAGAGHVPTQHRNAAAKYAKFCYSNQFGFSLASATDHLASCAPDSMLALSDGDGAFRVRTRSDEVHLVDGAVLCRWRPWRDVAVTTWLIPVVPWHVRVHRIETGRPLTAAEGGFALDLLDESEPLGEFLRDGDLAAASTAAGWSVVVDLLRVRAAEMLRADPNTNVLFPRSVIPLLRSEHCPGVHWLACAVVASTEGDGWAEAVADCPQMALTDQMFTLLDCHGRTVFASRS